MIPPTRWTRARTIRISLETIRPGPAPAWKKDKVRLSLLLWLEVEFEYTPCFIVSEVKRARSPQQIDETEKKKRFNASCCDNCHFELIGAHTQTCCYRGLYCKFCVAHVPVPLYCGMCKADIPGMLPLPCVDAETVRLFPHVMQYKSELEHRIERGLVRDITAIHFGPGVRQVDRDYVFRVLSKVFDFSKFCELISSPRYMIAVKDQVISPHELQVLVKMQNCIIVTSTSKYFIAAVDEAAPFIVLGEPAFRPHQ